MANFRRDETDPHPAQHTPTGVPGGKSAPKGAKRRVVACFGRDDTDPIRPKSL